MATFQFFLSLVASMLFLSMAARHTTFKSNVNSPSPVPLIVCDPSRYMSMGLDMNKFSFCNTSLSYSVRAKDLVERMTLAEKVYQLGNSASGVARLGLPKYEWWSEALHGVSNVGPGTHFDAKIVPGATCFPNVILTAAAFNETLWKTIGEVVSTEARAMFNLGLAGLTYWSPNINVVRDPRWGRVLETPGEDPYTVGRYATNYVRGLQDVEGTVEDYANDLASRPLKVASCCKHYAAYDIDNWQGVDRFHFDAKVTERDMVETFVRPFEMCVKDGDVSSVMCSYNSVNGIPACADPKLLGNTIRGDWKLNGYIVSDCDSLEVMYHGHHFLNDTQEDTVAQTMRAGLDLDCGSYYPNYTHSAVQQGKIGEPDVDKALVNLYVVLMRLGFFDGQPAYAKLGKDDVCSESNIELAAEAAREGIVLLKNRDNTLPLDVNKQKKIVVIGNNANATDVMRGNYAGIPCRYVTPIEGLSKYATVEYHPGCKDSHCTDTSLFEDAVCAAKTADATILVMGLDTQIEAEGHDRNDLLLPGQQTELINRVMAVAGGPKILVIMSGGAVDINFAKNNWFVGAMLWVGYPGGEGGRAIADVIYGKYNPGGRLPLTWYYNDYVMQIPMTSMSFRPLPEQGYAGRTYKFFTGQTVYPFGYGMSYSSFNYTLKSIPDAVDLSLGQNELCHRVSYTDDAPTGPPSCASVLVSDSSCEKHLEFEVAVNNLGPRDGSHVVLVYDVLPVGLEGAPIKQLVAFQRVHVLAGRSETVKFKLNVCESLYVVDSSAYKLVPAGEHTILIGDEIQGASFPLTVNFG
ncbi:beta-xylosidase/alpha-L-arabinofuranosidase 1 [Amborella trichopoda]|nr:beta-xylosidase/alpha-L-arabinofuranosidase 1 [Amborella trichopoda]|eukprot:XP_006840294.3 beta-xylosidase/alpha-L-arabinofuranosidase 1 [Amborella trichopoda]